MRVLGTYFPNAREGDKEALIRSLRSVRALIADNPQGVALYTDGEVEDMIGTALEAWIDNDHITIEFEVDPSYKEELIKEGYQLSRIKEKIATKTHKCDKCGAVINSGDIYLCGKVFYRKDIKVCKKCDIHWWELSKSRYIQQTQGMMKDIQDFEHIDEIIDGLDELESFITADRKFLNSKIKRQVNNIERCIKELKEIDITNDNWRNEAFKVMEGNLW